MKKRNNFCYNILVHFNKRTTEIETKFSSFEQAQELKRMLKNALPEVFFSVLTYRKDKK